MSTIQQYLKEIGRGKDGARALSRAQACELLGWVLDGQAQPEARPVSLQNLWQTVN